MARKRRTYSQNFKEKAARLVLDRGYSVPEASRSLGVGDSVLRRWVTQLTRERAGETPVSEAITQEQRRIQELEKRVVQLEREKSILREATSLLMSKA